MSDSESQGFNINLAIILGLMPFIGYFLSYRYEKAYAEFFGYPIELIELDLTRVFEVTLVLLSVFLSLWFITFLVIPTTTPREKKMPFSVRFAILMCVYTLAPVWIFRNHWKQWIFYVAFLALVLLVEFVLPLFTQKSKKGYIQKLFAQEEYELNNPNLTDFAVKKIGRTVTILILIFFFALQISSWKGSAMAMNKEEFYSIADYEGKESVVLAIYGENFVCAPLDKNNRTILQNFTILNLGKLDHSVFSLSKVGPLIVNKGNEVDVIPDSNSSLLSDTVNSSTIDSIDSNNKNH